MNKGWEVPDVEIGDTVLYKPQPGYPTWFKFDVGEVGDNATLSGLVFYFNEGGAGAAIKDGVRHVDDPALRDPMVLQNLVADGDAGVWRHTNRILRYEAAIAAMERNCYDRDPEPGDAGDADEAEEPVQQLGRTITLSRRKKRTDLPDPAKAEELGLSIGGNKRPSELVDHNRDLTPEEKAAKAEAFAAARPRGG